jgi:hypothetical protein
MAADFAPLYPQHAWIPASAGMTVLGQGSRGMPC